MDKIAERIEKLGAAKLIGSHPSGSAAWMEQRQESIGGSDIASILNLSPFKSCLTLWYEKAGALDQPEATMRMKLGNYLEEGIIRAYADDNPNLTIYYADWTFESTENSKFHANPDAVIEDKLGNLSILEIKHTGRYWTELPEYYRYQVLWYQYVTGLKNPATVVAVTGGDLKQFIVEWDETLMEYVKGAVNAFLGLLSMGEPPDHDGGDSTYQTIRDISPDIEDVEYELECATELLAAKQIFDAAEENLQKYKAKALDEMQGARIGTFQGVPIVQLQQRGAGKPYLTFTRG